MKEKEDKLRLVKQILVDDNGAIMIPSKDVPESTMKATSDTDTRTSRKVVSSVTFPFELP